MGALVTMTSIGIAWKPAIRQAAAKGRFGFILKESAPPMISPAVCTVIKADHVIIPDCLCNIRAGPSKLMKTDPAALMMAERLHAAAQERPLLPARWRSASTASDWVVHLSPNKAREAVEQLTALVASLQDETTPDAEPMVFQVQAFPSPGHVEPGE